MNIAALSLIRCKIFQKKNQTISLFLNFHHSIMDEQSLRIFMTKLYSKVRTPKPVTSPRILQTSKGMQYIHYCLGEQRKLGDATCMGSSIALWNKHLAGMDVIALPLYPAVQPLDMAVASFTLSLSISKFAFE
jgi:hypothetical protein